MKQAAFKITATVEFEDNCEDDLMDQAFEALNEKYSFSAEQDFEEVELLASSVKDVAA
jgi:hypothetical protein